MKYMAINLSSIYILAIASMDTRQEKSNNTFGTCCLF